MNSMGLETQLRVWDRVQGKTCAFRNTADIAALYMEEKQWADRFRVLARATGEQKLQQLSQRAKERANCLGGMYIFMAEEPPGEPSREESRSPTMPQLRRAYVDALRRKKEYEKYIDDEEYGIVFADLAGETGECCKELLKVVGRTAKP